MVPDPDLAAGQVGAGMTIQELYRRNPVLTVTGAFNWILAAVLMLVSQFDTRTILGINPWIKPIKFSISIAIYVWTLAWFLHYISGRKRAVAIISWVLPSACWRRLSESRCNRRVAFPRTSMLRHPWTPASSPPWAP